MLSSFTVERFRSLADLRLDLGRINVFIGANGSGKSNLLEAVGVLGAAASGRIDEESLRYRGVRTGGKRLYRSAFADLPNVPHIRLSATTSTPESSFAVSLGNPAEGNGTAWKFEHEKLTQGTKVLASRGPRGTENGAEDPAPNTEQGLAALEIVKLGNDDPALQLMGLLRNYAIYDPNTPTLRGLVPEQLERDPIGLAGGHLADAILQVQGAARGTPDGDAVEQVRDLIEWADTVVATQGDRSPSSSELQFHDRFMRKEDNVLTARDASEGALYVLFCAALALHPVTPRLLGIDNFGQALNPRLVRGLMTRICEWTEASGRQWLITTHHPSALDGLPLQDPAVRLFAVERTSRGHTVAHRIDLPTALQNRPDDTWSLSRMWTSGLLGAVPDV